MVKATFVIALALVRCFAESAAHAEPVHGLQAPGVVQNRPVFADLMVRRLDFPLSWNSGNFDDFTAWRTRAREVYREALQAPPPAVAFAPEVLAQEDRGTHLALKLAVSLTGDSRVTVLMTLPKGAGPFPAALLLHDHGARFDIGKEKVIAPLGIDAARQASALEWVKRGYGGRFIGDELARRGYVCLATDVLNWSDRGGGGYEGQQAIASNLLNLGSSFAGLIAWEDLRAAEFLASHPQVDARSVAAIGWSMGGFRAWQVAALSDHIVAAVSVCWMSTLRSQMAEGSNQTRGQSAFTMTHPGLSRYLDYPDLASIACPKPMLVFAGRQDKLFAVDSVGEAFASMRRVWASQQAGHRLTTRIWDKPHIFDLEMQDEAFAWLDAAIK